MSELNHGHGLECPFRQHLLGRAVELASLAMNQRLQDGPGGRFQIAHPAAIARGAHASHPQVERPCDEILSAQYVGAGRLVGARALSVAGRTDIAHFPKFLGVEFSQPFGPNVLLAESSSGTTERAYIGSH